MENIDAQQDELIALSSIYEKDIIIKMEEFPYSGSLVINVSIEKGITVGNITNEYTIYHMPPINLVFDFPSDYPNFSPPNFKLNCTWLDMNQIHLVTALLKNQFHKGLVVLYDWMSLLRDELLNILGISDKIIVNNEQLQEILFYNEKKLDEIFSSTYYDCSICLNTIVGELCIQLKTCKHIFCKSCLTSFLALHINEGSVNLVKCPSYKCSNDIPLYIIQELVPLDLFERYDNFLLKSSLDLMGDIMYCPRKICNSAVIVDDRLRLGSCPTCMFSFCIYCKQTYHGIANCTIKSGEIKALIEQYLEGNTDEKSQIETKYGKKYMETLIEEYKNNLWMKENSKQCPSCKAYIEKIDGCNKMICSKCGSAFCWLCTLVIDGYRHFNDPSSKCLAKLFD